MTTENTGPASSRALTRRQTLILALGIPLWIAAYSVLPAASKFATYTLMGLETGTHLASAVEFFVYDTPKILLLLTAVVFAMGVVHSFFTHGRVRNLLLGRGKIMGSVFAAVLGIFTPFCSCSAVPLFIGFVNAGIPLGITFSFLVSAPMINEVALVLLWNMFGWKIASLYVLTGLSIAIVSGLVIGKLNLTKWVEPWVFTSEEGKNLYNATQTWSDRVQWGFDSVRAIVGKVWPWVVAGIALGALIHGYVPENTMTQIMGKQAWWTVPAAVLLGVPMYSNAAGVIPVMQALLGKGAALGTVLAFMMAVIGLSLPEAVILKRVLRIPLLLTFFGIVATGIVLVGYFFNAIL
jgi:uncharacterized membrane protein YraQ (UPF0718 family)